MKKILFILLFMMTLCVVIDAQIISGTGTSTSSYTVSRPRYNRLKAFGGYGLSWISDFEESDSKSSFHLGMSITYDKRSPLVFEHGIRYINKGYSYDFKRPNGRNIKGELNYHFVEAFYKVKLHETLGQIQPYTGVSAAWCFTASQEDNFEYYGRKSGRPDVTELSLPIGVDFMIRDKYVLNLEYNLGLAKLFDSRDENHLSRAFIFSMGAMF